MFSVLVIILVVSGLSFLLGGIGLVLFFRLKGQLQDQGAQLTQFMDRFLSISQEGQSQIRQEWSQLSQLNREEQLKGLKSFNDSILKHMTDISTLQKNQLDIFAKNLRVLTDSNDKRLESVRKSVEDRIRFLQEENSKKLDEMRKTVDEKLHATLEKRLGESFKLVSDRLDQVHKGLGEMKTLAQGVGDLKKVLTNVKTSGTWGEVQLGAILEQILTPQQYEANVRPVPGSQENVEYAVKLPGGSDDGTPVWLPIDSKFPQEYYRSFLDAQDRGDVAAIEEARKQLEMRVKQDAKSICEKYVQPPHTTDFGVMFLPTEGLYAELIRQAELCDLLHQKYRVLLAGPSTLAALLNSLQMGFRTLAIEKRSSEVWSLLSAVKAEFGKFGDILDKTHKKLQEAGNTIELASRKSRTIERKLRGVEELPVQKAVDSSFQLPENNVLF